MDALQNLSRQANTQVVITTHSADIVKGLEFNNIRLILNNEHGYKEIKSVEQKILPSPSLNEVNYLAFGDWSWEYHNELYGYLQAKAMDENNDNIQEKHFDPWLQSKGCNNMKSWTRIKKDGTQEPHNVTIQTYIRNYIHHPENTINMTFTNAELKSSIEKMIEIAKTLI